MIKKIFHDFIENRYSLKIVSCIILILLTVMPFSMTSMNLFNMDEAGIFLYPYNTFLLDAVPKGFNFFYVNSVLLLLMPIFALVSFVSIFVRKITIKIVHLLSFIAITVYLAAFLSGIVLFANTSRWFDNLSSLSYFALLIALLFHIFLIARKIVSMKQDNESYWEYKTLLREEEKKQKQIQKRKIELLKKKMEESQDSASGKSKAKLTEYIDKLKRGNRKTHIKTKIIFVFILTIAAILSTFVYIDLRKSKILFTQTINNTGKSQAEQVAAIYCFSDGLHSKISAFLEGLKQTNSSAPFPSQRVDIITTSSKEKIFLEEIDSNTKMPVYDIFSYTTAVGRVREIPEEEKQISSEDALKYVEHFKNEKLRSEPLLREGKGTCIYIYPITFPKKQGQRLIGFSIITYFTEVLNRPYFQTKTFVIILAAVFLYASIIITLFLSDFIGDPIIALCGSIRKTANTLREMFSGNAKIEASRLVFEQSVKSNDEIKKLSVEIKNIISLVRGILPYVSYHTIQNAERKVNRQATTRDLCFLFTDIRGFTSMCENLPPKDIIPILNHYLDIETKIIFENGGDVDKYVGDSMMAFFSGPRKEIRACKAAMEIRRAMQKEKIMAVKTGTSVISIGIGISSGPVVFGSVGATTRKDFTSIGDTVNLAARLEGANKAYGSKAIISEAVYEKLTNKFICRELDYVTVKGKTEPVRIYEILQVSDKDREKVEDLKKLFETGLAYYRKKKWKSAEKYFMECEKKYNDNPAKAFLKRIEHYKISPPDSKWKGVFVMNVK